MTIGQYVVLIMIVVFVTTLVVVQLRAAKKFVPGCKPLCNPFLHKWWKVKTEIRTLGTLEICGSLYEKRAYFEVYRCSKCGAHKNQMFGEVDLR